MYTESERNLFEYNDGKRIRKVDPIRLESRLGLECGLNKDDVDRAAFGDLPSQERVVAALLNGFQVTEYDEETGEGFTRNELFALFQKFIACTDQLAKKNEMMLNSNLSIQESSQGNTSPLTEETTPDLTTKPIADCISTANVSNSSEVS